MGILKFLFGTTHKNKSFIEYANGRGLKDYPCNSKNHSPTGRYPCTDFTPFIQEALKRKDHEVISGLILEIVRANPGMGTREGLTEMWNRKIKSAIKMDLKKHFSSPNPNMFIDLKSVFPLILLHHDFDGFITTNEEIIKSVGAVLAPYHIKIMDLKKLEKKANKFIKEMRKDTPYWETFDLYSGIPDTISFSINSFSEEFIRKLLNLPLITRVHLLDIKAYECKSILKNPAEITFSVTRKLGIDGKESAEILEKEGFLIPATNVNKMINSFKKDELLEMALINNIEIKRSWTKKKISEAIINVNDSILTEKSREKGFMEINPQYDPDIILLQKRINDMVIPLKLVLGFGF